MHLTQKSKKDLFIDEMAATGLIVEYWDVSFMDNSHNNIPEQLDESYCKTVANYSQLEEMINKEVSHDVVYIPQITYWFNTIRLYRLLTKYKCRLFFFGRYGRQSFIYDISGFMYRLHIQSFINSPEF